MIDGANLVALNLTDALEAVARRLLLVMQQGEVDPRPFQLAPRQIDRGDGADESPPFLTFEEEEAFGIGDICHLGVRHPAEILAEQVVIADPVHGAAKEPVIRRDLGALRIGEFRKRRRIRAILLAAERLARDPRVVIQRHHGKRLRPEGGHTVPEDQGQESGDQDDAQRQGATQPPQERFAHGRDVGRVFAHRTRLRRCLAGVFFGGRGHSRFPCNIRLKAGKRACGSAGG